VRFLVYRDHMPVRVQGFGRQVPWAMHIRGGSNNKYLKPPNHPPPSDWLRLVSRKRPRVLVNCDSLDRNTSAVGPVLAGRASHGQRRADKALTRAWSTTPCWRGATGRMVAGWVGGMLHVVLGALQSSLRLFLSTPPPCLLVSRDSGKFL